MSFNLWSRVDKLCSVSALHQVGLFGLFRLWSMDPWGPLKM